MVYYLKIAGVGVKVNCPNNLYLFDEWKIFFEERWGKAFLVKKIKPRVKICLNGLITKGMKVAEETKNKDIIDLPKISGEILYFNNLLNQGYFLDLLGKMVGKEIIKKGGTIFHSSGIVLNNKAVLIMGESGSGKTTTLKKLVNKYWVIAEDEVAVFKDKNNQVFALPLLFSGKLDSSLLVKNSKYKIGAVITIKKNSDLKLEKMPKERAIEFLLEQSKSLINNVERAKNVLKYISLLNDKVYILSCRKEDNLEVMMKRLKNEI